MYLQRMTFCRTRRGRAHLDVMLCSSLWCLFRPSARHDGMLYRSSRRVTSNQYHEGRQREVV